MEQIELCRINQTTTVDLREQCHQPRLALKDFDFEVRRLCSWLTRLILPFDVFATQKKNVLMLLQYSCHRGSGHMVSP